jgi:predicted permease
MLSGLLARVRSLWQGVRRRPDVEAEMDEEFRLHVELRAADLVKSGLQPNDAVRPARLEFGSAEWYKDAGLVSRGLRRVDAIRFSWLDFKLGFRMLVKYPVLTVVGGIAIAFAIAVGAGAFEFVTQVLEPTIPLRDGDRLVGIQSWDVAKGRPEQRLANDVLSWRKQIVSIEELGAFRQLEMNLIDDEGRGEPVGVAAMSASGFRIAGVRPVIGRPLIDADEQPSAPPVIVIGYDAWQARFDADPDIVGRTVRLGDSRAAIVGVMPKGFAFPVAYNFWVPLRLDVPHYMPRSGPEIRVFGRLAPGVTLAESQAEVRTVGLRAAADAPMTHEHLQPRVMPFAQSIMFVPVKGTIGLLAVNVFLVMLLVLVFGNVALLVFARAATRDSEIVVRTALGASRARIVMQLFAEALVLGGVGAAVGLVAADFGLQWGFAVLASNEGTGLPFWMRATLAPATVLYAVVLTLVGSVIAGVMPALKVTRSVEARLRQVAAGGGGLRFGGVWTTVIVTQVAVTVAFPVTAFFTRRDAVQIRSLDLGYPAREYLSTRLELDVEPAASPNDGSTAAMARLGSTYGQLARRLALEPTVDGVTFANLLPGMDHPQRRIEVDGGASLDSAQALQVSSASVDVKYFDVIGAPIVSGRPFTSGDLGFDRRVVIVNRTFVRQVLGDRNPIGRRVRYVDAEDPDAPASAVRHPGPWLEIVGVVKDLAMTDGSDPHETGAGLYQPVLPGSTERTYLMVHLRGGADPSLFSRMLRTIAAAVDPTLRLDALMAADRIQEANLRSIGFWLRLLVGVSGMALLLSLAGIYAVMAFTVSRRTREIGIRLALGAGRRRVITAVLSRPLTQVGGGVLVGGGLVALLVVLIIGTLSVKEIGLVAGYAALMMGVCLLACIVPTRRAMQVEPTEVLRSDG